MGNVQEQLERYHQVQGIINTILKVSLEPLPLQQQLERILELILTIPWLAVEAKGSIFLADESTRSLVMVAQQGLSPTLLSACARLPYGKCLCGQAAESGQPLFSTNLDERHHIRYAGIADHGHYCIPIKSRDALLGVLNLYVAAGHQPHPTEEGFLDAAAHTLAGVIERRLAEENLEKAREELELVAGQQTSHDLFSPALVRRVFAQWEQSAGEDPCWPPPPATQAKAVLEAVFVASLKKKEEVPTRITLSLVTSRALLEEMNAYDSHLLMFAQPLRLSPQALVTLAPSFDPVTTSLVVMPCEQDPGHLEVVGAIFFSKRGHHRFNAMAFAFSPLDIFSVVARDAGHLLMFRGNTLIGTFSSGEFSEPVATSFTESPLAWFLLRAVQSHPEFKRHAMAYWDVYRDLIDRLLVETTHRGHGGTIIWFPRECRTTALHLQERRHPLARAPEGAPLIARYAELERRLRGQEKGRARDASAHDLSECKRDLIELVELLAQLACMDGALVINDRLQPLAFGTMLTAKPWRGEVISWVEEEELFPTVQVDFSRLGARHHSALNFVGRCPGAIAFVISQDGPVSGLVRKDEHTIYWWPDCLSKLWEG